jgi:hypothetical protein
MLQSGSLEESSALSLKLNVIWIIVNSKANLIAFEIKWNNISSYLTQSVHKRCFI